MYEYSYSVFVLDHSISVIGRYSLLTLASLANSKTRFIRLKRRTYLRLRTLKLNLTFNLVKVIFRIRRVSQSEIEERV